MPLVSLDARDATPLYAQLERARGAASAAGRLRAGDQLPTVGQRGVELRITPNPGARVYAALERNGILEPRRGVGSFVRASAAGARPRHEHERRLRAFVTRLLADAAAGGFTPRELIAEIQSHRKEGS